MGCTFQGQTGMSNASDHIVVDCSNLIFYSAFCWLPAQIHKIGVTCLCLGALQTRRAAQFITLNFVYNFLGIPANRELQ